MGEQRKGRDNEVFLIKKLEILFGKHLVTIFKRMGGLFSGFQDLEEKTDLLGTKK